MIVKRSFGEKNEIVLASSWQWGDRRPLLVTAFFILIRSFRKSNCPVNFISAHSAFPLILMYFMSFDYHSAHILIELPILDNPQTTVFV